MDNKNRAMLFFGVVIFVLIVMIFWNLQITNDAAGRAVQLQQEQISKAKECSTNCDSLAESGELSCDWIECHERCQAGKNYPYCNESV